MPVRRSENPIQTLPDLSVIPPLIRIQRNNTIIKKNVFSLHCLTPHFHRLTLNFLLVFTLCSSFNCLVLRFKINKLLIFVVRLAIFFPQILDQIGLMLGFFFFLF